ncbi:MAG: 50S ribosomal protein L15 [Patescibacteria group bacterium]
MNNILSNLPKIVKNKKKRLGRGAGSGKGAKSGRGTTRHQTAREDIPLAFEGGQGRLIKRFPLLRGKNKNRSYQDKPTIITLEALNIFDDNEEVTMQTLVAKKILKETKNMTVKVLGNGKLSKKLTVSVPVSASAKKMIEEAGGQIKTV